jgi:uncharacterized protein YaiE (UPF0345 family)
VFFGGRRHALCRALGNTPDFLYHAQRSTPPGARMSEFKNVSVVKQANVYFDGKVTSRSVIFPDGSKKTLGIMQPGEYEFTTGDAEIMEIMSGELEVLLPGAHGWKAIQGGESFEVAANSKFAMKVRTLSDYCCSFIK